MDIRGHLQLFLRSRFLRILIIGGVGFIVQTIVFEALSFYMPIVSPSTAVILGGELAVLTNFSLNERFSFNDRIAHNGGILPRLLRLHIVISGSLFIQWALISFTEHYTQNIFALNVAYISGVILGFVSNYIGYHLFVWKKVDDTLPISD